MSTGRSTTSRRTLPARPTRGSSSGRGACMRGPSAATQAAQRSSTSTNWLVALAPGADAGRRRLPVAPLPRDDRVAQHADPLDLGLDHVAGLEVEPLALLL